jgi:hypothetical protein
VKATESLRSPDAAAAPLMLAVVKLGNSMRNYTMMKQRILIDWGWYSLWRR